MELLTVKGLSGFFGISEETIRSMLYRKLLPAPIRIGGRIYWIKEDIEAFLKKKKEESERKGEGKKRGRGRPSKLESIRRER